MYSTSPKSKNTLLVRAGHSLSEPQAVLDEVSQWISPEWRWEGSHSDTVTWDGGRVLLLLPPVIGSLRQACSCLAVSAASTALALSPPPELAAPEPNCSLLSEILSHLQFLWRLGSRR